MRKNFLILFIAMTFLVNSAVYAFDPGCIAGGCENSLQQQGATSLYETGDYECVCPPKDTVGTIINVIGVLLVPLEILSSKPNLVPAGNSFENLIKEGCKCRLKHTKKENNSSQESEQEQTSKNSE